MPRNIVICCDGTGNEFGVANSNVVNLYSALDLSSPDRQIAYYHPGLGTMGAPTALTKFTKWWTRLFGLMFGRGLMDDISDAYAFLMEEFSPGDTVFIFGFSRGAYTARALAGMLHMFGLVREANPILIRYVTRMFRYRHRETFHVAADFKKVFSIECQPHFMGLWDTVSSVGWIYDPVKLPYTANNPDPRIVRHAIAIDERRCYFWQNLWGVGSAAQDVKQVWFPGVHSDIGGGYPEKQSGLSKIAMQWMLREASAAGLLVNPVMKDIILGSTSTHYAHADAAACLHKSLHGVWWLAEFLPRRFVDTALQPPVTELIFPRAAPRKIPEESLIHESTFERTVRVAGYEPPNLPQSYTRVS